MYKSRKRLLILDADGASIDAFTAIEEAFERHGLTLGDEHKDFHAAIGASMHPFMVSYGFEDYERLTESFDIPAEVISRTPEELCARVRHALDLPVKA